MDENNDAAARREARRRRILQNPEERMRKLKGLKDDEAPECENYIRDEPVQDLIAPLETPTILTDDYIHRRITAASDIGAQPSSRPAPLFEVAQPETPETEAATELLEAPPVSLLGRLIYCKLHVILLAIVVRTLLALHHGYLFGDMVLVPIIWLELTLFLTGAGGVQNNNQGGLIGAALILSGFGQSKVHSLLKIVSVLQELATNVSVYLFFFLLSHVTCLWLGAS